MKLGKAFAVGTALLSTACSDRPLHEQCDNETEMCCPREPDWNGAFQLAREAETGGQELCLQTAEYIRQLVCFADRDWSNVIEETAEEIPKEEWGTLYFSNVFSGNGVVFFLCSHIDGGVAGNKDVLCEIDTTNGKYNEFWYYEDAAYKGVGIGLHDDNNGASAYFGIDLAQGEGYQLEEGVISEPGVKYVWVEGDYYVGDTRIQNDAYATCDGIITDEITTLANYMETVAKEVTFRE